MTPIVAFRDELLGGPVGEQRLDFRTVLVQLAFAGAFRPSDRQAGSPSRAKGFFRPRGDQPRSISAAIFPPKSRSKSSPKIGRRQIDDIYAVSTGYRKSYGGFGTFEPLGPKFHTLTDFPLEFEFYTHELDNRIRPKLTDVLHVSRPFGRCEPVPIGPSSARSFTGKSIQSTPQRHRTNTALTRHVFFIGIDKNPLRNFQLFGSMMEAARDFG